VSIKCALVVRTVSTGVGGPVRVTEWIAVDGELAPATPPARLATTGAGYRVGSPLGCELGPMPSALRARKHTSVATPQVTWRPPFWVSPLQHRRSTETGATSAAWGMRLVDVVGTYQA
jgi:hypothetical protein